MYILATSGMGFDLRGFFSAFAGDGFPSGIFAPSTCPLNEQGESVASGVYVYRLRATAGAVPQVVTRKLLLIR